MEIRDSRLYRESYDNFQNYCRERWQMSRFYAYRLMDAAEVSDALLPIGNIPSTESEARELAPTLKDSGPDVMSEVWVRVVENSETGQPTAAEVRIAVHFSSNSVLWSTPPEIIERAQKALGSIDLDPRSNPGPKPIVPALRHYTREDHGLSQECAGRVYMNPPYGRGIGPWVTRLVSEHAAGRVPEAIALVPARVDTDWFRPFRDGAICFIDGRLKFSGHDNSAPFPSAVVYLGCDIKRFAAVFEDMGDNWVRWDKWPAGGPPW
jgi:DNA N-6-adenine-methyltransferase (Dam)